MVFACLEHSERAAKASPPASLSAATAALPRFQWGSVRFLRCHLPHANYSFSETDSIKKEASASAAAELEAPRPAMAPSEQKDASFDPPQPRHEEGNEKRKRKKEKMAEFRITLTKDEIDEDFFGMTAARAPRRPRRRPKAVQSQIEVKNHVL